MPGIDVARAMGAAFGPGPDQVLYGVVANVGTNTVDVYLGNSATGVSPSAATGLPYLSGYNPAVGDAVCVLHGQGSSKSSFLVLGTVAGSSAGSGSTGLPIGFTVPSPFVMTIPNWLLMDGRTVSAMATDYPVFYALNGNSNVLPDWRGITPMGAGVNGITLGTRDANGHTLAHTHTGAAHTHTGPSHSHTDSGHSHGHSHTPSVSTSFVTAGGGTPLYTATAGTGFASNTSTNTDSTSGNASLNNSGTGATGSTTPGAGGSTGTGSANVPPNYGVNWYVRAA